MNVPKRPVRSTNLPPSPWPHSGQISPVSCGPFISSPLVLRAPVQSGNLAQLMNLPERPSFHTIGPPQVGHFHFSSTLPIVVILPTALSLALSSLANGL